MKVEREVEREIAVVVISETWRSRWSRRVQWLAPRMPFLALGYLLGRCAS